MTNAASISIARPAQTKTARLRRIVEVVVFVALWMGIGLRFRLDANAYLLLGIPLTAFFQLAVRRKPIRALWVRSAPAFCWDGRMFIALLVHMLVGIPLSPYWRRSGNLGVPALTHSLVDALRNALLSGFWI
jgi:membrane protease YdiL (CAAX protease family)